MAKRKTLRITVPKGGGATVETDGFQGAECVRATRHIEQAMGGVERREKKREFYRSSSASVEAKRRG